MGMRADEVYAILNRKIRDGGGTVTKEQIEEALNEYFQNNAINIDGGTFDEWKTAK